MCNINILLKVGRDVETAKVISFISGVTTMSFLNNSDGEGVYLDKGVLMKSEKKLDYWNLAKEIGESNLIMTHQRLATSGFAAEYIHPFENKDFVLVHNGVLASWCGEGEHSDTYIMFEEFKKLFKKKKGTREEKIIKSIKELFKDEYGSWSVAIYDKKDNELYYFKDNGTRMNMVRSTDKKIMYLSTADNNLALVSMLKDEFDDIEVKSYAIYKLWVDTKGIKYKVVGKIGKKEYAKSQWGSFAWDDYRATYNPKKVMEESVSSDVMTKIKTELGIVSRKKGKCFYCESSTRNYLYGTGKHFCDGCLDEYYEDIQAETDNLERRNFKYF